MLYLDSLLAKDMVSGRRHLSLRALHLLNLGAFDCVLVISEVSYVQRFLLLLLLLQRLNILTSNYLAITMDELAMSTQNSSTKQPMVNEDHSLDCANGELMLTAGVDHAGYHRKLTRRQIMMVRLFL